MILWHDAERTKYWIVLKILSESSLITAFLRLIDSNTIERQTTDSKAQERGRSPHPSPTLIWGGGSSVSYPQPRRSKTQAAPK